MRDRCELCERRCGSRRYLCVGCAGQLGLIGSLEERRASLARKLARLRRRAAS